MRTLLLDTQTWDLVLGVTGDIAVADPPYALAQDAASALRLFSGELWYDTRKGLPYWISILGHAPPLALLKAEFNAAAKTVPGVTMSSAFISSLEGRRVSGQVQIMDEEGITQVIGF